MKTSDRFLAAGASWLGHVTGALSGPRLSILIFHRVLPRPDPLFPDEMDAARFDCLMAVVARAFDVLPLGRALELRDQGRLPPRALSITFDDGYADNAEVALPILARHGLQATFFVATGFLDGGRMFNDSVIECLRATSQDRIDLAEFGLAQMPLVGPQQRRAAIEALLPKVKYMPLGERERFLHALFRLAGRPPLPADLMMRSSQVVELHKAGMEIGGHTINHPILSLLPDEGAEAEIAGGRACLQELIDAPVEVFAYPNGRPTQDYDARHVEIVKRLGFSAAVSTATGVATTSSDRFQLPRFTPWGRDNARWMGRLVRSRLVGPRAGVATTA